MLASSSVTLLLTQLVVGRSAAGSQILNITVASDASDEVEEQSSGGPVGGIVGELYGRG